MSTVTIHGPVQSTYVRTARMVCEEKGVPYELAPLALGSAEHLALHPFGRVPVLTHGDVKIYETSAIARYVDEVFPGPSLIPGSPVERARMETWISQINSYMYDDIIRNYVFVYFFPKTADGKPDRAKVEAALPNLKRDFGLVDKAVGESEWLAGGTLSLADLFLCPILFYAAQLPEARELMGNCKNMQRAGAATMSRPSFTKTAPPAPAS